MVSLTCPWNIPTGKDRGCRRRFQDFPIESMGGPTRHNHRDGASWWPVCRAAHNTRSMQIIERARMCVREIRAILAGRMQKGSIARLLVGAEPRHQTRARLQAWQARDSLSVVSDCHGCQLKGPSLLVGRICLSANPFPRGKACRG